MLSDGKPYGNAAIPEPADFDVDFAVVDFLELVGQIHTCFDYAAVLLFPAEPVALLIPSSF
jgi:hypothetical protein